MVNQAFRLSLKLTGYGQANIFGLNFEGENVMGYWRSKIEENF